MPVWIAQYDTETDALAASPACVAPGVDPATAAKALGWPDGSWREITDAEATALQAPTVEEILADYETRIQARLDEFARTLTYDGIQSACTYAASGVEMYRIEGQYCVDARDATWARAYELLSAILPTVQAGGAVPPWEDIIAQLPPLVWPEGSRGKHIMEL